MVYNNNKELKKFYTLWLETHWEVYSNRVYRFQTQLNMSIILRQHIHALSTQR